MEKELARAIKNIIFAMTLLLMPCLCLAMDHIVISEVLYNPINTETGGEAVQMYNPTDTAIDISGYLIATESSVKDATIPASTMLQAHSTYLVADAGWSTLRDNQSWPSADHEEAITMSNTDSGVAITYPNGTIIDAAGWGNASGINAGLYEGTPAPEAKEGNSLRRSVLTIDTNNNSADLKETEPPFQYSASSEQNMTGSGKALTLNVNVQNNAPTIDRVMIGKDDDNSTPGVQIIPMPEGIKKITITADVTDLDGVGMQNATATITGPSSEKTIVLSKIETLNSTTERYNATILMDFFEDAGIYDVTVIATDSGASVTTTTQFEYLRMAAISVDASALQFTQAKIGITSELKGDYALSTANAPTIKNTGNTQINLGIYGSDLTDGQNSISVQNIKYSFDNDFASTLSGTLGKTIQTKDVALENSEDSVISLGFQLFVPATTQNGNYTGQVTVVAISE